MCSLLCGRIKPLLDWLQACLNVRLMTLRRLAACTMCDRQRFAVRRRQRYTHDARHIVLCTALSKYTRTFFRTTQW